MPVGPNESPQAKRFKRDDEEPVPPSPVLHIRSLPLDVTDYEVRMLMPNPQLVVKSMVLRNKGQAFVQFVDVNAATMALRHFDHHRAQVRYAAAAAPGGPRPSRALTRELRLGS